MVYEVDEDSFLLSKVIKEFLENAGKIKIKKLKVLDMGSGTGILAETAIKAGILRKNVLAVDIDKNSIKLLKQKKLNAIQSDLFLNIDKKNTFENTFDLIFFNAPYLPEDKNEPPDSRLATTAGKKGYEIIIRFLKEASKYLNKNGKIFLLFSSLSKPRIILNYARKIGYNYEMLAEKKIFFENILVYEFYHNYL
jgi:release factor glutamine methyltransferase